MSSGASDPNNPAPDPTPEDDWGDAVQLVRDESGGSSVLPARRESSEKTVVTIIDGEGAEHEAEHSSAPIEEKAPPKKLKVREFIGRKINRLRPNRPEVAKMPRKEATHAQAKTERWEIEGKEWTRIQTFQTKWVVGIVLGMIALIVICLSLLPLINRSNSLSTLQENQFRMVREQIEERDEMVEELLLRQDEARAIFNDYVEAEVADDILPSLRNSKGLEPMVREKYHNGYRVGGWNPDSNVQWSIHKSNGSPFAILSGVLSDYSPFEAYFVIEDGAMHMDWESTTGYGTASFEELIRGVGDASEVRGTILPAVFYTMDFPEAEFQSYQLISPNGEEAIWCYVKRDSEVNGRLARLFMGGGIIRQDTGSVKGTLKLKRGPEGSYDNQWLIENLLHEQWISFE